MFISFPLELADSLNFSHAFDLEHLFNYFDCLPRLSWKELHTLRHIQNRHAILSVNPAFQRILERPKCWNKTPLIAHNYYKAAKDTTGVRSFNRKLQALDHVSETDPTVEENVYRGRLINLINSGRLSTTRVKFEVRIKPTQNALAFYGLAAYTG